MQEQDQKAEGGPVGFSSNEQQQFVSEQQEAYNYTMGSLYVGDLAPEVKNLSLLQSEILILPPALLSKIHPNKMCR